MAKKKKGEEQTSTDLEARGSTPPVPKKNRSSSRPLVDATRTEIRALRSTLEQLLERPPDAQLRADLQQAIDAVRSLLEQSNDDLRTQLTRTGGELRDELSQTASQLRAELERAGVELRRVAESVRPAAIDATVTEATQAVTSAALKKRVEPLLEQLQDAYGDLDDHVVRLQSYVKQFGPGGLPVMQQAKEFAERRVSELEQEIDASREQLAKTTHRLTELDSERQRRNLQSGISVDELDRRLADLDRREGELSERDTLAAENLRLSRDVEGLRAELEHWKRLDLEEREARSESHQLAKLLDAVAHHDAERTGLLAELDRTRDARRRAETEHGKAARALAELEGERAAADDRTLRLEALEVQVQEFARTHEQDQTALAERDTKLLQARTELGAIARELGDEREQATVAELSWRRNVEQATKKQIDQAREELEAWARTLAENLTASVHAELTQVTTQRDTAVGQNSAQASQITLMQLELATARAQLVAAQAEQAALAESFEARRLTLESDVDARLERLRTQLEGDMHERSAKVLRDAEAERDEAQMELSDLQTAAERLFGQLNDKQIELEERAAEVATLTTEKELIESRIAELRVRDVPDAERVGSLLRPWFEPTELAAVESPDEGKWLSSIEVGLREAGFTFHPRLVRAFHTSLKISREAPLVVLAGISGTGKSELPRLYADLGGLPFQPLAVQPSWDSPHDLFGFFNYSDGRLSAEPLARILRQVGDREDPLRESPALVLLDEMNIARVEYYFAELLSKLEARRGVLGDSSGEAKRRASVLVDTGPGSEPYPLYLDERVLFVGTMNEDESTLTLSDKVLDRACVLTFPAPRGMTLAAQPQIVRRTKRLSWDAWSQWIRDTPGSDFVERLNEINRVMETLGRPFGHRLFRAIHAYLANYPGADTDPAPAWSDQFAMKIIPRLRGLEVGERSVRAGLDTLAEFVPDELQTSFDAAREREFFAWSGAAQLYQDDG